MWPSADHTLRLHAITPCHDGVLPVPVWATPAFGPPREHSHPGAPCPLHPPCPFWARWSSGRAAAGHSHPPACWPAEALCAACSPPELAQPLGWPPVSQLRQQGHPPPHQQHRLHAGRLAEDMCSCNVCRHQAEADSRAPNLQLPLKRAADAARLAPSCSAAADAMCRALQCSTCRDEAA